VDAPVLNDTMFVLNKHSFSSCIYNSVLLQKYKKLSLYQDSLERNLREQIKVYDVEISMYKKTISNDSISKNLLEKRVNELDGEVNRLRKENKWLWYGVIGITPITIFMGFLLLK
jgi:ATP-dependent Zn protease